MYAFTKILCAALGSFQWKKMQKECANIFNMQTMPRTNVRRIGLKLVGGN